MRAAALLIALAALTAAVPAPVPGAPPCSSLPNPYRARDGTLFLLLCKCGFDARPPFDGAPGFHVFYPGNYTVPDCINLCTGYPGCVGLNNFPVVDDCVLFGKGYGKGFPFEPTDAALRLDRLNVSTIPLECVFDQAAVKKAMDGNQH